MRRLLKLLLVGGLLAGAWAVLRELLGQQQTGQQQTRPSQRPAQSAPGKSGASGNGAADVSKAELYREAQKLDVEGRSKMSKDELAEAVARARKGGG
jgi:DNA end-binding protein Ku